MQRCTENALHRTRCFTASHTALLLATTFDEGGDSGGYCVDGITFFDELLFRPGRWSPVGVRPSGSAAE